MIDSGLGVELGFVFAVLGISLPLFNKAINDMKKAASEMAEIKTTVRGLESELKEHKEHNYRDMAEMRQSHRSIFAFLMKNSQAFRDSRSRRND